MEPAGGATTVKTTSSCSLQPAASVTVKRSVAVAGPPFTCTVAGNEVQLVQEVGASMEAPEVEETTLQAIELMGLVPGWAVPVSVNGVEAASKHLVWSFPAWARPSVKSTCRGVITSVRLAEGDCDVFDLIRMVLIPMVVQGLKMSLRSSVMSTAASEKVFLR